ncbi:hypothetical protein CRUP_036500 [Coryphaenoides rupestris]|nr:hypothetical protein CRUP_036500 [Coryphaenoides rupestris]
MDSRDDVEHPLLGDGPRPGRGLLKGVLVRCEEDRVYPPLAWRAYCGGPARHLLQHQHRQQVLDPCSLPRNLEPYYPPSGLWGPADPLLSKDYLETTFVDIDPGSPLERKLLAETQDLQSLSYSDEDDLLPDFEAGPWEPLITGLYISELELSMVRGPGLAAVTPGDHQPVP